jgi:S-DNA-T family DNA segregation ATPase FtsK/SpoIIIE
MHERSRQMQGIRRKFIPSVETPLNVVVIDEMGYLSAYLNDKKLQARANTAIAALLAKGRAPGYAVVGAAQDPRKEVCGFRDGFSIRIAGSLPAPMVDLVLGEGMYEAGAYCNRIPLTEPGVAYVISETTLKPVLVRAAWCDDAVIQQALLGPVRKAGSIDQLKTDDLSSQLDWNGQPLRQFRQFR